MKRIIIYLLAVTAIMACTQPEIDVVHNRVSSDISLSVGFESNNTRIQLDQTGKSVWNVNDTVSVFYNSEENQEWKFQGATGDRVGTILPTNQAATSNIDGNIVVVYPYDADTKYYAQDNTVKTTVAQHQQYAEESYGSGGNILVAQGTNDNLSLKNVYGWLKVSLTGDGQIVKSIILSGNNGEQLAGDIVINAESAAAEFCPTDTPIKTLRLNSASGVKLTANPTSFYIGVVPQIFERGVTIEIEDISGEKMVKSTSNTVVINRRHILPMQAVEFKPESGTLHPTLESISGTWHLTEWRGVTPSFDVYMSITNDYKVTLWQRIESRQWDIFYSDVCYDNGTISGVYTDGTAWRAAYDVVIDGSTMTWIDTEDVTDVSVYKRCELPNEVPPATTRSITSERFL